MGNFVVQRSGTQISSQKASAGDIHRSGPDPPPMGPKKGISSYEKCAKKVTDRGLSGCNLRTKLHYSLQNGQIMSYRIRERKFRPQNISPGPFPDPPQIRLRGANFFSFLNHCGADVSVCILHPEMRIFNEKHNTLIHRDLEFAEFWFL